jgi:ammonium transporter, Amt family
MTGGKDRDQMLMNRSAKWLTALGATLAAFPAHAAQVADVALPDSGDTAWLLTATILGLLLAVPGAWLVTAAPAGREALLRAVPATAAALAAAGLLYVVIGYSFAFDTTEGLPIGTFLGGTGNWMLSLMGIVRDGTSVPETAFALYQFVYLAIAVALLCGALGSHVRGGWLVGFAALWSLIVFAPLARWMWGGGWVSARGGLDMAGGLVVFYAAGVSAIIALALAGAGNRDSGPADPQGRGFGAAMLLAGMLAIAGASTLGASDGSAVAIIVMLVSAVTAMLTSAALSRRLDGTILAGGLIAGTVGVAAAGDGLSMGGAVLMGLFCAFAASIGPRLMPKIFARHAGDGTLIALTGAAKTGAFLFAFLLAFYPFGGSGYADGMTMTGQVVEQLIAIIAVAGWSIVGTLIAALSIGMVMPMRAGRTDG